MTHPAHTTESAAARPRVDRLTCRAYITFASDEPANKPRKPRTARVRPPDGLRTKAEAAAKLGCSIKTLDGHIEASAIRYVIIGHGKKRPRKMFTDADLNEFIASQTSEDSPACPSSRTRVHRSTATTSGSKVIAFSVRRNARPGAKRKR